VVVEVVDCVEIVVSALWASATPVIMPNAAAPASQYLSILTLIFCRRILVNPGAQ
jgi:hypothetical protein